MSTEKKYFTFIRIVRNNQNIETLHDIITKIEIVGFMNHSENDGTIDFTRGNDYLQITKNGKNIHIVFENNNTSYLTEERYRGIISSLGFDMYQCSRQDDLNLYSSNDITNILQNQNINITANTTREFISSIFNDVRCYRSENEFLRFKDKCIELQRNI